MVNAFNTAITGGADGIAVCLVDQKAFNGPTDAALKAKIPVVAYNADAAEQQRGWPTSARTCSSPAQEMGKRIVDLVPSGDVALFIATPGSLEHPAADRRRAQRPQEGHGRSRPHVIATGADAPGGAVDRSTPTRRATRTRRATSPSTPAARRASPRRSRSTSCATRASRAAATTSRRSRRSCWPHDQIDFTIDQQPYLQGFLPILQLYLYKASETLSGIADVNTGPEVPRQDDGRPVQQHQESRYEGTSSVARGRPRPRPVAVETGSHLQPGASQAPAGGRGRPVPGPRPGAREMLVRFLTLREGSIIVVTLLTILYFSRHDASTSSRTRNFKNAAAVLRARSRSSRRARCC